MDDHGGGPQRIPKAKEPIAVDGVLDEPAWEAAWRYELSYEVRPGENIPAVVRTVVLITFTDSHLYVGFRAFDPEQAICYGCRAEDKPQGIVLKRCDVRACVREKELDCCIECPELSACDKDLWRRFPKFKEQVIEMQERYRKQIQGGVAATKGGAASR